jgi:hypothetical protein
MESEASFNGLTVPGLTPKTEAPRLNHGLENYLTRHFGLPLAPIDKRNWNFGDPEARALGAKSRLNQKGIAFGRVGDFQKDLQGATSVTPKTTGAVAHF